MKHAKRGPTFLEFVLELVERAVFLTGNVAVLSERRARLLCSSVDGRISLSAGHLWFS